MDQASVLPAMLRDSSATPTMGTHIAQWVGILTSQSRVPVDCASLRGSLSVILKVGPSHCGNHCTAVAVAAAGALAAVAVMECWMERVNDIVGADATAHPVLAGIDDEFDAGFADVKPMSVIAVARRFCIGHYPGVHTAGSRHTQWPATTARHDTGCRWRSYC